MKRRTGSWLVNYDFFDQYHVLDPLDLTKGWGIFANIGLTDQATNSVRWFLNLRVGGERPLPGRSADSFGVGYYDLGISSELRQILGPFSPIRRRGRSSAGLSPRTPSYRQRRLLILFELIDRALRASVRRHDARMVPIPFDLGFACCPPPASGSAAPTSRRSSTGDRGSTFHRCAEGSAWRGAGD